eukprot:TRINITY_DN88907_c0_g1_i1.p1 TRINITY_DN88907_c0_g1~~TRINITY_DN88907_c0_g1_i1.p1  ORF type:complete len:314 (-),score=43.52 TRINITY_DN88907_c0_g1_i1:396-1337(-)
MDPRGRHKAPGRHVLLLSLGLSVAAFAFCRSAAPGSAFLSTSRAVPLVMQLSGSRTSQVHAAVQSLRDSNHKARAPPFLSQSVLCAMGSSTLLVAILAAASRSRSKGSSLASGVGRKAMSIQISLLQPHRLPAAQCVPRIETVEQAASPPSPAFPMVDLLGLAPLSTATMLSAFTSEVFVPKEVGGRPHPSIGQTARHVSHLRAARRVSGARHGCRRSGRQASVGPDASTRRQRRAAGSQLLTRLAPEPQSMSFDASRIRTKVQLSLRSTSSLQRKHSRSREPHTVSGNEAAKSNELLGTNYSGEVKTRHGAI